MKLYNGASFEQTESWSGPLITQISNAAVKLRWTEEPYKWHTNTGEEVFVVLDGIVDMHVREGGKERVVTLQRGDVFHVTDGDEHVAHPRGVVRLLIVEGADSD